MARMLREYLKLPSEPCDSISIQMVIIYTQGDIVRCLLAFVRTVQVPISICHYWQDADSPYKIKLNFSFVHYEQKKTIIYYSFLARRKLVFFVRSKNSFQSSSGITYCFVFDS